MNDVFDRIKEFWSATSTGQKLTLGAATLGVLVAAIAFLAYSSGGSDMVPLVRNVAPDEMPNQVEADQIRVGVRETGGGSDASWHFGMLSRRPARTHVWPKAFSSTGEVLL